MSAHCFCQILTALFPAVLGQFAPGSAYKPGARMHTSNRLQPAAAQPAKEMSTLLSYNIDRPIASACSTASRTALDIRQR